MNFCIDNTAVNTANFVVHRLESLDTEMCQIIF